MQIQDSEAITKIVECFHRKIKSKVEMISSKLKTFGDLDEISKDFMERLLTKIEEHAKTDLETAQKNSQGSDDQNKALASLIKLLSLNNGILEDLQTRGARTIKDYAKRDNDEVQSPPLERPLKEKHPKVFHIASQNFLASLDIPPRQLDKLELTDAADSLAKMLNKGKTGFFFDVDDTLIATSQKEWKMPEKWINAVEKLLNNGVTIAIITGRTIEEVEKAFDNAGDKGIKLKDKIEICGGYGDVRKGPKTNGEQVLVNKRAEKYVPEAAEMMKSIEEALDKYPQLNQYREEGLLPITTNKLGGSILVVYNALSDLKKEVTEETANKIYNELKKIASEVLKSYPAFRMKTIRNGSLQIRQNQAVTGLKLDKGEAVHALVKDYELERILVCGDGQPDIVMEQRAQQLVAANKFISAYIAESKRKDKLGELKIFNRFIEMLEKRLQTKLTDTESHLLMDKIKIKIKQDAHFTQDKDKLGKLEIFNRFIEILEKRLQTELTDTESHLLMDKIKIKQDAQLTQDKDKLGELEIFNRFIEMLGKSLQTKLTDAESNLLITIKQGPQLTQDLANPENELNQDLLSLNETELQDQFLIGVESPPNRRPVKGLQERAVVMVDQPDGTIELTNAIASNLENLKI